MCGGGGCMWWLYVVVVVVVVCGGGIFLYIIFQLHSCNLHCGGFVLGIYSTDTVFACMVMLMYIICTAWVTEVV